MSNDRALALCSYTGRRVWPLAPAPEDIHIQDIAHALSNQCRWGGHTREFLSVAQHCVMVAQWCPPGLQLVGLLHDAAEAYLQDLVRPLKRSLRAAGITTYDDAETEMLNVVMQRFGLPQLPVDHDGLAILPQPVKAADEFVGCAEARDFMCDDPEWVEWRHRAFALGAGAMPKVPPINPWTPATAKAQFLSAFAVLYMEER